MIHHLLPQRKRKGEISFSLTKINSENYKSIAKIVAEAGDRTRYPTAYPIANIEFFWAPRGREKIVKLSIKTNNENLSTLALTI